jgi:hypothetical protein
VADARAGEEEEPNLERDDAEHDADDDDPLDRVTPSRRLASSSRSPRMLRSHGEVRRAAGGRPVSSS